MTGVSFNIVQIDQPGDPRIADYANLTDAQLLARALDPDRPQRGLLMVEGELVLRQLVESSLRTRSVLLADRRIASVQDALERLPAGTPIYVAPQEVLDQITGFHIHRGILAAAERPEAPDLDSLLARARALVLLEDLANHDNVGGIFRTTAAIAGPPATPGPPRSRAGAAILYSPRTCDPFYRKSIRVSIGSVLHMPSARLDPWPDGLSRLKRAGFTLIALTPDPSARSLDNLNPNEIRNPALLLGAEGDGLTARTRQASDIQVRIPVVPPMDSLNVVVAAGIALHHFTSAGK